MKCTNENCQGGWINTAEGFIICECIRQRNIEKFYKWSNAPKKYQKRLNELEDQNILNGKGKKITYKKSIEQMTKDRENIDLLIDNEYRLILKGGTGSGKTQYAVTLATEMVANYDLQDKQPEINKFYFLSLQYLDEVIFSKDEKVKAEYHTKVRKANILIIDDLGVELNISNNKNAYIIEELNHIIRSFTGLLIITTNIAKDLKEVYEPYSTRLASVLVTDTEENHGNTNNIFYTIATKDNRRKKKNTGANFL